MMTHMKSDGLVYVSEMTDDATLRTNITSRTISGRDAIQRALEAVDALIAFQSVSFQQRIHPREIRICEVRLIGGVHLEITSVAVRDPQGWVCELHVDYDWQRENLREAGALVEALEGR